jgi:hypothetical protein
MHRDPLYVILRKWWNIDLPVKRKDEYGRAINKNKLVCFETAKGRKYLHSMEKNHSLVEPHHLALRAASKRRKLNKKKNLKLTDSIDALLGDTSSKKDFKLEEKTCGSWRKHKVKGFWFSQGKDAKDDPAPGAAVWLILPKKTEKPVPAVVCTAMSGKKRFLYERASDIENILASGIAVALVDPRGIGETSPGPSRLPEGRMGRLATELWMQKSCFMSLWLADIRQSLQIVGDQKEIDPARIGLWGESFAVPVSKSTVPVRFDETGFRQSGPLPREVIETAGAFLVLTASLYPAGDSKIKAVLARGGLASYESVLARHHHYLPLDGVIPGLLNYVDVKDILEQLVRQKIKTVVQDLRDGSGRVVAQSDIKDLIPADLADTYSEFGSGRSIDILIQQLKK